MQQQNDWYTGIDYFQSYKEQDILVEEQSLAQPVPLGLTIFNPIRNRIYRWRNKALHNRFRSHGMNAWSSGMF